MSDTPETDAAKFTTYSTRHGKYIEAVTVDFARAQERKIAELDARWRKEGDAFIDAKDEIERLRSQLNKAEVERAWALRGKTFVTPEPQL